MMMMLSGWALILGLFLFSTTVDARSSETLIMKIFDPDNRPSDALLEAMLKKADLEGHGYKTECTTSVVSEPGSYKSQYRTKYLYYKIVECSRTHEINQELRNLLSGAFGVELITKVSWEIKARNLTNIHQCKVGLEIHCKGDSGFLDRNNNTVCRKRGSRVRRGSGICIGICIYVEAAV